MVPSNIHTCECYDCGATYGDFVSTIKRYMPTNYRVYVCDDDILIAGNDVAGWTLDGYVIPRLASGGYTAKEI